MKFFSALSLSKIMLKESKKSYMEKKKNQLTEKDANVYFFRLVRSFSSTPEKEQTFDVRTLRRGNTDTQTGKNWPVFSIGFLRNLIPLRSARSRQPTPGSFHI